MLIHVHRNINICCFFREDEPSPALTHPPTQPPVAETNTPTPSSSTVLSPSSSTKPPPIFIPPALVEEEDSTSPDPLSPAMQNYAGFLQAVHRNAIIPIDHKGGPTLGNKYFELVVIRKDREREEADELTRATTCGGVDEFLKQNELIELEDVFKREGDRRAVKFVLVEGEPGVGKSTLAWELSRRWHKIAAMRAFSAVVHLRLYKKTVQEATCLKDLLYHDNHDIQQAVVAEISSSGGKNILFILDGYDEVPAECRRTFFLRKVISGEYLPKASILVTSRASAVVELLSLRRPSKHFEVLGFARTFVMQYARYVFRSMLPILADYCKYIASVPAVESMMCNPLICSLVMAIYLDFKLVGKPFHQTLTQLYAELILVFMWRYYNGNDDPSVDSLPAKIEDLRLKYPEIHARLLVVAKLAFEGTLKQKTSFDELPEAGTTLGLMTIAQHLHVASGKVVLEYSFPHFTLQDFLMAFYLSHLPADEQRKALQLYSDPKRFPYMDLVWMFVAGLTGFQEIGWELVHSQGGKHEDGCVAPLRLQCLYEAQENANVGVVLVTPQVLNISPSSLFESYAAGYCIAKSSCTWKVDFSGSSITGCGAEMLEMLLYGLRSQKAVRGSIDHLDLSYCHIGQNGMAHIQSLAHIQSFPYNVLRQLSHMDVHRCLLDDSALDQLSDIIFTMAGLRVLDIGGNPAREGGTVKLLQSLEPARRLSTLRMHYVPIGHDDIVSLSRLIEIGPFASLKELAIGDCGIRHECVELLLSYVLMLSSLRHLTLWEMDLTAVTVALEEYNHNLATLKVFRCTLSSEVLSFSASILESSTTLKSLYIGDSHLLVPVWIRSDSPQIEDALRDLSNALKVNRSLEVLSLHFSPPSALGRDGVQALLDALCCNETLKHLKLPQHCREIFSNDELTEMDTRVDVSRY